MADEVNIKISGSDSKKTKVTTKKKKSPKKKTAKKTTQKKKTTKKKAAKKTTTSTKKRTSTKKTSKTEKILIENFVSMQKVMTNMAEKFDGLSNQISKLLKLFEDSAETLVEKDINLKLGEDEGREELLEKLNRVLDQNKIIAKGLTLMHETASNPETHYSLQPYKEPQEEKSTGPQKPIAPLPKPKTQEAPEEKPKMTMSRNIQTPETFSTPTQSQQKPNKQKVFESDEDTFAGY